MILNNKLQITNNRVAKATYNTQLSRPRKEKKVNQNIINQKPKHEFTTEIKQIILSYLQTKNEMQLKPVIKMIKSMINKFTWINATYIKSKYITFQDARCTILSDTLLWMLANPDRCNPAYIQTIIYNRTRQVQKKSQIIISNNLQQFTEQQLSNMYYTQPIDQYYITYLKSCSQQFQKPQYLLKYISLFE